MTIKNKLAFVFLLALILGACEETKYDIIPYSGDNFYRFTSSGTTIFEDDADPIEIPVRYSTTVGGNGSVEFQITGGTEGTDFEALGSGSLSFDAGNGYEDFIRIQPLLNTSESDIVLEIQLVNPQAGVAGFPGPDANSSIYQLTIQNACTPIPVGGTYLSVTTGQSTDGCCPDQVTDLASIVTIEENGDGGYTVSDFSAGMYLEWYDVYGITADFALPATLSINGSDVIVDGSEPFGTAITGTGTYDKCTGDITYTWKNGYDDTATVNLKLDQ